MTSTMTIINTILAAPGALLLLLCFLPVSRASIRAWLTPALYRTVKRQLPWVVWAQSFKTPTLTRLVSLSALTVTVEWYLLSIPPLYWMGYEEMALKLVAALAIGTYLTCALKDLGCGPRPYAVCDGKGKNAIEVLENKGEIEYGAPSMHTSLSLIMNMYIVYLVHEEGLVSVSTAFLLYGLALGWSAWIGWTRMYLGMHTPVDLFVGAATALSFFYFYAMLGTSHLWVVKNVPAAIWLQAAVFVAALKSYPLPATHTTSYMYAVTFLGASQGMLLSYSGQVNVALALRAVFPLSALNMIASSGCVLKVLGGFLTLAVVKVVSKEVLVAAAPSLLHLLPGSVRVWLQPPIHSKACAEVAEGQATPKGVLLQMNGYPWDAQVVRVFVNYGCVVSAMIEYGRVARQQVY